MPIQPDSHLQGLTEQLSAAGTDVLLIADATNGQAKKIQVSNLLSTGATSINLPDSTELTIASGAVTVTQSTHTIDTEADAAGDDLDTINMPAIVNVAWMKAENGSRAVTIKHGTGNIITSSGADFVLPAGVWIPFVRDGLSTTVIDPVPAGSFTNYTHNEAVAASVWTITHSLGRKPSVELRNLAGDVVFGAVNHVSVNQCTVTFAAAVAGSAYLV